MEHWPFGDLTPMKYGAILVDPPWAFDMRSEAGHRKSPEAHYNTMPIEDIAILPVGQLAGPDCYLFLWSTWPHLTRALRVMQGWGFSYVTGGVWTKRTATGKLVFGTGYVLHGASEPFLVGKIGSPKVGSRSERNVIDALRREHSRKPPEMRQMIERLCPDVWRCELFAREPWEGADVWGNEVDKFAGDVSA